MDNKSALLPAFLNILEYNFGRKPWYILTCQTHLKIPRNELVVLTGLSGSGKSSLAFDTIYAEGQRRYMESLSSYARQFLGQMEKPDVESIEGLSLLCTQNGTRLIKSYIPLGTKEISEIFESCYE